MFVRFPAEMFKDEYYRVVHGPEEAADMLKKGWSEDRPEDHPYIPITAKPVEDAPEAPKRRGRPPKAE